MCYTVITNQRFTQYPHMLIVTLVIVQMACQAVQLSVTIPCSSPVSVRSD